MPHEERMVWVSQAQISGVVQRTTTLRWRSAWRRFSNPEAYQHFCEQCAEVVATVLCSCATPVCAAQFSVHYNTCWRCLFDNDYGDTHADA